MLSRATKRDITSTTIVGVVGADDWSAFDASLADIADEFGLDATARYGVGTCVVRLERGSTPADESDLSGQRTHAQVEHAARSR